MFMWDMSINEPFDTKAENVIVQIKLSILTFHSDNINVHCIHMKYSI